MKQETLEYILELLVKTEQILHDAEQSLCQKRDCYAIDTELYEELCSAAEIAKENWQKAKVALEDFKNHNL